MRFIHQESDEITRYVKSVSMHILRCDNKGSSAPMEEAPDAIDEMLRKTDTLWGLALPYYLIASKVAEIEPMPLDRAVARVEASGLHNEFLIVAYQDGGVISISGDVLPFQEHAKKADWWRPITAR